MRRTHLFAFALCALLLILPAAAAAADAARTTPDELEALMAQFMDEYGLNGDNFAMSYLVPASGEAYSFCEERYHIAASLYKLPLNMLYYDYEREGVLAPDASIGGWSLDTLHYQTIVNSNNDMGIAMLYHLGSFWQYRQIMTQFCEQDYPAEYYADNNINARYMMAVLERLYGAPDDYEELIGYLKLAAPGQYFARYVDSYEIAHKYGFFDGAINDCAIVYTPEPFLLVAFTQDVANGEAVLGRLCQTLCDYTVARSERRAAELDAAAPEPEPEAEPEPEPEPEAPAAAPITVIERAEEPARAETDAPDAPDAPADGAEGMEDVPAPQAQRHLLPLLAPVLLCAALASAALLLRRRRAGE